MGIIITLCFGASLYLCYRAFDFLFDMTGFRALEKEELALY